MTVLSSLAKALVVAAALGVAGTAPADAQAGRPLQIVVLGDSLSAGFLLPQSQAFPAVLEATLRARGVPVSVVNASVSGSTSSDGLARLDGAVPPGTDGVILELGANDRLQGVDPSVTQGVLDQIVGRLRARGVKVLLAGVRFSNDGRGDPRRFDAAFQSVARRYGLVYYPDFYSGLRSDPSYTLFDGVHPSAAGVQRIVGGILPTVTRFLGTLGASGARGGATRRG